MRIPGSIVVPSTKSGAVQNSEMGYGIISPQVIRDERFGIKPYLGSLCLSVWPTPSARVFAFMRSSVYFNVFGFRAKPRAKMKNLSSPVFII